MKIILLESSKNVIKNSSDKYLLNLVNAKYTLPSGDVTIKSNKARKHGSITKADLREAKAELAVYMYFV